MTQDHRSTVPLGQNELGLRGALFVERSTGCALKFEGQRAYARSVNRFVVATSKVLIGVVIGAGSLLVVATAPSASSTRVTPLIVLDCPDSVGQQGKGHEVVVGGVEGLSLPDSSNPSVLASIRSNDGRHFLIYKDFLAVSSSVTPFATVSIASPPSASLVYASSARIGALSSSPHGEGLVTASARGVRLPVCGPRFTGFVGGVIVQRPTCVTFQVSTPHRRSVRVVERIGVRQCGQ